MHDEWGIAEGYHDVDGVWHATDDATRALLREAMGEPQRGAPMWFVQEGATPHLHGACRLILENGSDLGEVAALPGHLPAGYHSLQPVDGGPETMLVVHPSSCPPAPAGWGVAAQVYSLWRADGWGIGDLRDVTALAQEVATRGGVAVLLSPLHAPAPTFPQQTSPYYPSSRRWLNPLLIPLGGERPEAIANGRGEHIDRDQVWRVKRQLLAARFSTESEDPAWRRWAVAQGPDLAVFCSFNALADEYGAAWRSWPDELRDPASPAVSDRLLRDRAFADRHEFHAWCQWLAHRELEAAAAAGGCALVGDLAVGCSPDGADAWIHQDLLALDVRIGAPPDPFNEAGQEWGLPPFVPWRLRRARYAPFIAMVRAGFRSVGGLRIDHVMGLFRQFWIPAGHGPADGAYVQLPADELLAIIALEAHRAGSFVVGEDLGTVQPEVRAALAAAAMLGTKVWWFETDVAGWPEPNLATVTTHDLPTIAGVWAGTDGTPEMRAALVELAGEHSDAGAVAVAVHDEVARSAARLVMATLDDLAGATERPNHPGTLDDEHPNWRLRLSADPASILAGDLGAAIVAVLRQSR